MCSHITCEGRRKHGSQNNKHLLHQALLKTLKPSSLRLLSPSHTDKAQVIWRYLQHNLNDNGHELSLILQYLSCLVQDFLSHESGEQCESVKVEQARTHLFIQFSSCNLFFTRQKIRRILFHLPGKGELEMLWRSINSTQRAYLKRTGGVEGLSVMLEGNLMEDNPFCWHKSLHATSLFSLDFREAV